MSDEIEETELCTVDDLEYFRDELLDECSNLFHHYIALAKTQAIDQTKILNQLFKIIEHCSSQEDMTQEFYHETIDEWYDKLDAELLENWDTVNKAIETAKGFNVIGCNLKSPKLSTEEYYISMC